MIGKLLFCLIFLLGAALRLPANGTNSTEKIVPPAPAREFRAAWITPIEGGDWPSRPGLSVDEQKAELTAVLDAAQADGLNAVLLHVRTAADAFYPTKRAPWSRYLTGRDGASLGSYAGYG